MKIRFSIGGKKERKFSFDTSNIPNENAREFADDVLKILAEAAKGIRERISQYEDQHSEASAAPVQSPDEPPDAATQVQAPDQAAAPNSPCASALLASDLGERDIDWLPTAEGSAAVVPVLDSDDDLGLWRMARDIVAGYDCYPVLIQTDALEYDMWDRLPGADAGQESPDRFSTIRAALFAANASPLEAPVMESAGYQETVRRFGRGPTAEEIAAAPLETHEAVDAFLWQWERSTFADDGVLGRASDASDFWYEMDPDEMTLLVLPVPDGPAAVKQLGFFPVDDHDEWLTPLANDLASWQEEFGAALVANYGTMLQFTVALPPADLDTAYRLANEHNVVGNATLAPAGIEVRHYAADLVGRTRWHLHDRP